MDNSAIWNVINKYFEENPQSLVRHHTESYNDFFMPLIISIGLTVFGSLLFILNLRNNSDFAYNGYEVVAAPLYIYK